MCVGYVQTNKYRLETKSLKSNRFDSVHVMRKLQTDMSTFQLWGGVPP